MGSISQTIKPLVRITKQGLRFIGKNSNVILTVISASGVAITMVCAIKGTIKAVKLCETKQITSRGEVVKTVWKCYIPTIGMAILTTMAIICNGRINAKKIAALTSAYAGSVETIKSMEQKMIEEVGPKKADKIIGEAGSEEAAKNMPADKNNVPIFGKGNQLFYLRTTGQWFYSDWNGVKLAEKTCQMEIARLKTDNYPGQYYRCGRALKNLGLTEDTEIGECMGWEIENLVINDLTLGFDIYSEWMDLPWGKEIVGIISFTPFPDSI